MKGEVLSPPDRYEPLAADDPSIGRVCIFCDEPLEVGQRPALVENAPADDEEAARAAAGRPYTALCDIVHQSCAYPGR